MNKVGKFGMIAALLIILVLVGQAVFNRTEDKGKPFNDVADEMNLRVDCLNGDKKACDEAKKLEDSK